jgi:hypothetical protein
MTGRDELLEDVLAAEAALGDEGAPAPDDSGPEDPELEPWADPPARHSSDEGPAARAPAIVLHRPAELDLVAVDDLLGVPLRYERARPPRPAQFLVGRSFLPVLEATVKQVRDRAPAAFGPLERISSAGMYVAKPGRHGEGLACDWDRFSFERLSIAPIEYEHASHSLPKRQRYWSLAAICRSNSCFVLHGAYDRAHRDHVHADRSTGVGFNEAPSTVELVQSVLNEIHGAVPKLAVDGIYGPRTRAAFERAAEHLRLDGDIRELRVFLPFLRRSARLGFAQSAADATPV